MNDDPDFDGISDTLRAEFNEVASMYFTFQNSDNTNEAETDTDPSVSTADIPFEQSVHDVEERTTVEQFISKGCGCKFGETNSNCSTGFSVEEIIEQRQRCLELTEEQLDLVILSQFKTLHTRSNDKERQRIPYMFEYRQVCQAMYMLLYCIGRTRLKNLKEHFFTLGLTPRRHKLKGQLPVNTFSKSDIDDVVKFLENYAEDNAVYLPGRFPTHKREDVQILPSSTTKNKVWETYKATALQDNRNYVGLTTFRNIWNKICPHIIVMKPMNDLCSECQSNTATISRSTNLNLRQKINVIQTQAEHLQHADSERNELRRAKRESEEVFQRHFPTGAEFGERREPCSFQGVMHYSYDYAQQVHYPSNPLQPGPIYFKTPRKCGIFGVHCEAIPRQINYLIDESVDTGKGANATISFVHHFLKEHGLGETDVHFNADNCSGQNKNNYFLWYYAWRTITGLHNSIKYSFLIAGHTKFSPDWCFGLFKQRFRRTFASSLFEISDVFFDSSSTGVNMVELCGLHSGKVLVETYDWVSYLSRLFKKIKGIKAFHHFRFTRDRPGVVFCKEYIDSEETEFSLLKNRKVLPEKNVLPGIVTPSGLSAERKKYLAEEIRQFCKVETQDLVAPKYKK